MLRRILLILGACSLALAPTLLISEAASAVPAAMTSYCPPKSNCPPPCPPNDKAKKDKAKDKKNDCKPPCPPGHGPRPPAHDCRPTTEPQPKPKKVKKVAFVTADAGPKAGAQDDLSLVAIRSGVLLLLVGGGIMRLSYAKRRKFAGRS